MSRIKAIHGGDPAAEFAAPVEIVDGASAAPAIRFQAEPSLGLYRSADGVIRINGDLDVSGTITATEIDSVSELKVADGIVELGDGQEAKSIDIGFFAQRGSNYCSIIRDDSNGVWYFSADSKAPPQSSYSGNAPVALGSLVSADIAASGPIVSGTHSISGGNFSCSSLTSSGTLASAGVTSSAAISAGTNAISGGALSCSSMLSSGSISCGSNSATCGSLTSSNITASGPIVSGTHSISGGAGSFSSLTSSGTASCTTLSCSSMLSSGAVSGAAGSFSSLLSSGTISCGTSAATVGSLTSADISANGPILSYTHSITGGTVSCLGVISSGAMTCGTQPLTCGNIFPRVINSGTYGCTTGSLSCTSMLSSGSMSCGTNAATCGALSSSSIVNSGTMSSAGLTLSGALSAGTNSATCGAISGVSMSLSGQAVHIRMASTGQTLSNNTFTLIADVWTTVVTNIGSITYSGGVYTVPATGTYILMHDVAWDTTGTGSRRSRIMVNGSGGTGYGSAVINPQVNAGINLAQMEVAQLTANDTLQVYAMQSSGGNVDYPSGVLTFCRFGVIRLF